MIITQEQADSIKLARIKLSGALAILNILDDELELACTVKVKRMISDAFKELEFISEEPKEKPLEVIAFENGKRVESNSFTF